MPTSMKKVRCPGCGHAVFKATMKPHQGILHCVECLVTLRSKKQDTGVRDRQRQRMQMKLKEKSMGVKYGSAESVEVVGDKAVISDKKLPQGEAEKVAAKGTIGKTKKIGSRRTQVTDKDYKRTDEDHIPGD